MRAQTRRRVVLSLGSNLGPSTRILLEACRRLEGEIDQIAVSQLYRTEPREDTKQHNFLNLAILGFTTATPLALLAYCRQLEDEAGRVRDPSRPKGPRTLDIDIIFFGDLCRTFEAGTATDRAGPDGPHFLTIPHPRYREREFVVAPILEIFPDCTDPCDGSSLRSVAAKLDRQGVYPVGSLTI